MHSIEKKAYGYKLTFGDRITEDEMKQWVEDSKKALVGAPSQFGVLVDMRTLRPLTDPTQAVMREGQALYKNKGMVRSAVILASAVMTMQFKRIAQESGIYAWERYLSAEQADWEAAGEAWVKDGVDPDKK